MSEKNQFIPQIHLKNDGIPGGKGDDKKTTEDKDEKLIRACS